MSEFIYHYIIFITWNKRNVGNNWAKVWDFDSGGEGTFGKVRLSPTGTEPPTHTATFTRADAIMNAGILEALGNVPFAAMYDTAEGWTWPDSLLDMGLQVIEDV